jgi:glycosyltransferase involved in cell wall biosynthesis
MRVIPNFIGDDHFADIDQRVAIDPVMLFVGRLEEDKGIRVLLSAALQLADKVKIIVIGQGPLEDEVREAERSGTVEYLGRRDWPEIANLMDTARAVVIPSLVEENYPMVALEAGARGCAVVGSDRGGLVELINQGEDGLLFPAGDSHALAQALTRLGKDPSLSARLGSARHRRTLAQNTSTAHLPALLSTYQHVLTKAARTVPATRGARPVR